MPYSFDPKIGRYRDLTTGKLVSKSFVVSKAEGSIVFSQGATRELAKALADGVIDPFEWRRIMREQIKDEYIRQALLGAGGRNNMNPTRWGSVGGGIADQYKYLENFYIDIVLGDLSEGQIAARAGMYINSAREAYNRQIGITAGLLGFDEVMWVLDLGTDNHCQTCLDRAAMGWQPVMADGGFPDAGGSVFPGDGNTICLTNDKCRLEYRNSITGQKF